MSTAVVPTVTVEPDALDHIEKVGMRAVLDHMLVATPRLIPGLKSIRVHIRPDWQYPQTNIIWDVRMESTTREVQRKADRAWMDEFFRVVPERPPAHFFYLKLQREGA